MAELDPDLRAGAENMLLNCGGLRAGDRLLVLCEEPGEGYYDETILEAVTACAQALGIETSVRAAPVDPSGACVPAEIRSAMRAADRTLFLSRSGDQIRFDRGMAGIRPIMSYALDAEMLASGFGRANHHGFVELKNAVNALFAAAREIRVTCPLGTNFSGPGAAFPQTAADVSVDRFPMAVFAPVPVTGFSGVVVQDGFLIGTGSRFYEPYGCPLESPVAFHFDGPRLLRLEGDPAAVATARAHYQRVGAMFGLEPFSMHSWHAGLHPGCAYTIPAAANFERWAGAAFCNPRLLHVHTCGDYAPGEISLNVLDPTIAVDGAEVWSAGRFDPCLVPGGADILARYPCVKAVFDAPRLEVGQEECGRLGAR